MQAIAVIDTETTGLHSGARVIELAIITFDQHGKREEEYSTFIRGDGSTGDPATQRVHGIMPAEIVGAPSFLEVWQQAEPMLHGHVLLAHNAPFDKRYLDHERRLVGLPPLPAFACTKQMAFSLGYARRSRGGLPGTSARLEDLVKSLGLDVAPNHRALADAEAAAALFAHFEHHHSDAVQQELSTVNSYVAWNPIPPRTPRSLPTIPPYTLPPLPPTPSSTRKWRKL